MFGKAMVHIAFIYEICRVVLSNTQRRSKVAMENPIAKRMVSMGKLYILYIYIYIYVGNVPLPRLIAWGYQLISWI